MASILTPPETPIKRPRDDEEQLALWQNAAPADVDLTPHLLLQLQDDLERARLREAFWISVVVHMLVVIFLVFSPKMFPGMKGVALATPADLMRDQQMTYLDLPPDVQKQLKSEAKILSDKNRTAMSRHPSIDKKTLEELRRAGAPGISAPPSRSAQATPPAPSQQPPQQAPNSSQGQQTAQLEPQPNPKLPMESQASKAPPVNFAQMMRAPGDITAQAAREVAAGRGGGSFGNGGSYGAGPGGSALKMGNLEILSDTQGVDFGPYLSRVIDAVRRNWYTLIPEAARAPLLKRGRVGIEFAILPDGKVAGMKLVSGSGDVSLDRAAWGGISASNPFAPLPSAYHAPYLALRFRFYYNPQKGDIE
jgi:TonB family protein